MPIKDPEKRREYFRNYMDIRRKTESVKPYIEDVNPDVKLAQPFILGTWAELSNDIITTYFFNGRIIRGEVGQPPIFQDFTEGGNWMVYGGGGRALEDGGGGKKADFLRFGQLGVDWQVGAEEIMPTAGHELEETIEMILHPDMVYDTAHTNFANPFEQYIRQHPDEAMELLQAKLKILTELCQRSKSMDNEIRKSFAMEKNGDEVVISTKNPDRSGDRVIPSGAVLDNYLKNPVIMWIHDYSGRTASQGIPIAKCPYVRGEGDRLISGPPVFLPDDPFAQRVKNAWDQGFIQTASIGFKPIEYEANSFGGNDYTKWELLEWSLAPIPMNAEAMRIAKSMGFEDLVSKPEVTDNYVRIPVEDPDKHKGHKIRPMDISKPKGIKALYCVDDKKIITYLFDVDKWTQAKAEEWVKEHKKAIVSQQELADEFDYLKSILCGMESVAPENKELALLIQNEISRITGSDMPVDIKTKSDLATVLKFCKSLMDSHHEAHNAHYGIVKDTLIKCIKDLGGDEVPKPEEPIEHAYKTVTELLEKHRR